MVYISLSYYLSIALLAPLFPYLVYKAKKIRKTVPELPEAKGLTGSTNGHHAPVKKLLFLGESTIAGVGVSHHKEGIAGKTCEYLHDESGEKYQWQVLARSGYRTKEVINKLLKRLPKESPDLIVIGMGGNDTFRLTSPLRFFKEMELIVKHIKAKYPDASLIIAGLPPVRLFPAFAGVTARILGRFVKLHANVILPLHRPELNTFVMPSLLTYQDWRAITDQQIDDLFSDGVHPSAKTYALWAKTIFQFILERKILS